MKSREGTVIDADNLMDEVHKLAADEISKRDPDLPEKELKKRAEKIAVGALKFFILKFDAMKTFVYDPKASIEFEGDTGPYVMYTYARCRSTLRKSKLKPKFASVGMEENRLVKKMSMFPETAHQAAAEYKPHTLTNYALELAALFNEYYHSVKVIDSGMEKQRLAVVFCTASVLKKCLELLGIEALEKM